MRRFLVLLCLLATGYAVKAQENYNTGLIPKTLLPYASAVVRNSEVTVEVKDMDNVVYHVKKAITVLNKNGDDMAHIVVFHDKSSIIKYIKGVVCNEFGQQINKFSESDFEDESAVHDFSLFEDTRVKHFLPSVTEYPYTISYEYELRLKQSLNFPDWAPKAESGIAVEKSSYTFICKPDFNIRYKEVNIPGKVIISKNEEGSRTYTWRLANMKAAKDESYSPNRDLYLSSVKIVPEKFSYEGINGAFTNWNELGKWIYDKLLSKRDQLPPETIAYIKDLVKDTPDPKEQAKIIYEYMQKKTRYISIQVGIGGYQPFLASDVDKLSYGDCKALVNYTQALLKAVYIDSYYCVVSAGSEKESMLKDFASMDQGDHIILCIPFKNDTTWLECTSQKIPFGFLGDFTDDRTVLACTPQGGILMHTPKYPAQTNLQERKAAFTINGAGELSGSMETLFKGVQYDNREEVIDDSPTDQVKDLQKIYPINNMNIKKFDFKQDKKIQPVTTENISLTAPEYASAADGKFYFMLNPVNRTSRTPREEINRENDVYISQGYTDKDEISYTIPGGYRSEKMPLAITITKPFGSYSATMTLKDNLLIYKRQIQLIEGTYPKEVYTDLVDFFDAVRDADNYSVSLIKSN